MNCPIDKVDDLIVLGMMLSLCFLFVVFGQWEAAQSLGSAFIGAGAMYVKGQS